MIYRCRVVSVVMLMWLCYDVLGFEMELIIIFFIVIDESEVEL